MRKGSSKNFRSNKTLHIIFKLNWKHHVPLGNIVNFVDPIMAFVRFDGGRVNEGAKVLVCLIGGVDFAKVRKPAGLEDHCALALFFYDLF